MRRKLLPLVSLLAFGTLAACGTTNYADTDHVVPAPSAAQTLKPPPTKPLSATGATAATGATTPAVTIPTSGPLSTAPKLAAPTTPAPTKLVIKDLIVGTGAEAKDGDEVTVDYVGALYKGAKVFNAWGGTDQPFPFQLGVGDVIKGWDQGVVGMRVGGRRELIVPSALGYGAAGGGAAIPPNSALIFVIDLLKVTPASS
jgi:peptidylprolyl isomerase